MSAHATRAPSQEEHRRTRIRRRAPGGEAHLGRFSGVYVFAALIALYALWVPHTFLTVTTVQTLISSQAITGIVTIGVVFALSAGAFDLSFGNNLTMSGVICGYLMYHDHTSPILAIIVSVGAGLLAGAVNAVFVTKIGVSSIVATLGMSSVLAAVTDTLTSGGQYISGFPRSFLDLATPAPLGIPVLGIYFAVVAVAGWYVLEHTPLGRRIQATGAGPEAATLAGVNTKRMTSIALVALGGTAAVAGVLATAQVGASTPGIGTGYLLPVIAAAFLGTTQIHPGKFNIVGTVLAMFLLATGVKGLQLAAGGQAWINDAFNGVALLAAVSFAAVTQRRTGGNLIPRLRGRQRGKGEPATDATPAAGA